MTDEDGFQNLHAAAKAAAEAAWQDLAENREQHIAEYRRLRREYRGGYDRWILLIKELRATHHVSILEAERIALSNKHRRRWLERAINANQVCRKHALSHIRYNGAASLIERDGDSFRFHIRPMDDAE